MFPSASHTSPSVPSVVPCLQLLPQFCAVLLLVRTTQDLWPKADAQRGAERAGVLGASQGGLPVPGALQLGAAGAVAVP